MAGLGLGGYMAGATTGAVIGATNGLISGYGIGLLVGASHSEALAMGGRNAWVGALSGAALSGSIQGLVAVKNHMNFWTGRPVATGRGAFSLKNTPVKAETPSIKLDAPKKPEINTDGLRSRPNALPDEPSFGPEPVKFGEKIDVNLGGELRSASGGKELYNFGTSAAKHMTEPGRRVPIQIMDDVLKTTKGLPDPGGSRALMHYSPMWRNGTLYNLEILYDKASNSIWHFQYNPIKPWIYVQ